MSIKNVIRCVIAVLCIGNVLSFASTVSEISQYNSYNPDSLADSLEGSLGGLVDNFSLPDSSKIDSMVRSRLSKTHVFDSLWIARVANDIDTIDSILGWQMVGDSLIFDSLIFERALAYKLPDTTTRPPRKPFLDAPVIGTNGDSMVYDVKTKTIYMHKDADVNYQDMNIKADYIKMGTQTKNVHAKGIIIDTAKKELSRPVFKQGDTEYIADSMDYNMDSGKALIKGVDTKDGEGTINGGTVKKMKDNTVHMHQGKYTVCDAACPHFYLQMTKATYVQGKQTVFGPAYMVFEDVPIYFLGVPFGFFPQTSSRSSGIIFPEIGEEAIKGFFIRNGGYYFAINDYVDLRVIGGIYTLGSWQVGAASNYALKYKFQGSVGFDYASDKIGEPSSPDYVDTKNMSIRWSHSQDPKFMPGSTFSASVNYTSSSYNKFNAQNMNDYLNTQTNSAINYSKNWLGKPFSLTVNASMSQNSKDSTITMTLPTVAFNVTRIAPFKRKNAIGKERWYEKISFTYNLEFRNEINKIKDNQLFQPEMWDKMKMGVKHTIPVSASFNLFQYLNISPSVNYNENWLFRRINRHWDDDKKANYSDTTRGFYRIYDYSVSLSFNTKLYGMYTVGKKKPTFFRHILTPSISAGFSPDNGSRYWETVQSDASGRLMDYNPYDQEIYGTPSRGRSASLSLGLNNSLEAKFPSDKDSTGYKKVKLIDQFNISTGYNFIADSMNLSTIGVTLSTNIANKFPLSFSATFDPYMLNSAGQRINKFLVGNGGFLRMTRLSFGFGYSFQGGNKNAQNSTGQPAANNQFHNDNQAERAKMTDVNNFFNQEDQNKPSPKDLAMIAATQYYDFDIPWSFGFNYSFDYSNFNGKPVINQTVNFNGNVNITQKWAVSGSAGYDFAMMKLTPGTIRVTRDLHCWQMSFQWVPIGFRQSWSFHIAVKSSMLSDLLKWEKNNSFLDNYYGNR